MEDELDNTSDVSDYPQPVISKPDSTKKRKTYIVIGTVVVVAILLFSFILLYITTTPPEIREIYVSLSESHSDYLDVTVLVGSNERASLAGEADLEITYNNSVIYTTKISIKAGGTGELDLPFNSFIVGNGEYTFQCAYHGKKSPPEIYSVRYILHFILLRKYRWR